MSEGGERWLEQPVRAWLIRAIAFLLPIIGAVAIATLVARTLFEPDGLGQYLLWWALVIGSSLAALTIVDRLARRLLPLAVLLRLSLLFPDRVPSRFRIALRSGSSGLLRTQVAERKSLGLDDDPTRAAEFILVLVAQLKVHDRRTRGHAERMRAYTDLLAEELGIDTRDQDLLRWAALLHDVGKLAVEAGILNKELPLDEGEWVELRHHPGDGYELTRPLHGFLGSWAATILHHHERYDGSGYPSGLVGDAISFGARIVAVADAYDAITAIRSYQPTRSPTAARRELAAAAGKQFDPQVVRAFLNLSVGQLRRIMGPPGVPGLAPVHRGPETLERHCGPGHGRSAHGRRHVGCRRPSLAELLGGFVNRSSAVRWCECGRGYHD